MFADSETAIMKDEAIGIALLDLKTKLEALLKEILLFNDPK
jgi:hypothetical protein